MFNSVPQFRVSLKNIWDTKEVSNKIIVNKTWILEDGGYTPIFYYIDNDKITEETFVKIVSNFNMEFLRGNIESITFIKGSPINKHELEDTIKLFILFRAVFGLNPKLLSPIIFKNTPLKLTKLIASSFSKTITEIKNRDIVDINIKTIKHEVFKDNIIAHGKVHLTRLKNKSENLNYLFYSKYNLLIIDDADLTLYYNFIKNPYTAYLTGLNNNITYYELKITNYLDEYHKTYTVLYKIYDISVRNKTLTILYNDDISNTTYKKTIKIHTITETDDNFIINKTIKINKNELLLMNPILFNKLIELTR